MLTRQQLSQAFQAVGLSAGDLVLVHSALRKLGPVDGGAETVIDALMDAVSPGGTVAVPTHTWKVVNAEQPVFHQVLTPSNVGTLTNVFRARPEAIRGLHPTHSIAAIGPRAAAFVAGHEQDTTPCSATSPYGRLRDWQGKILIIGVGLECCTFFHGCEEWAHVPGTLSPQPVPLYTISADGHTLRVPSHYHVLETWKQYPRLEPALLDSGALQLASVGNCPLRLLDARRAADWLVTRLKENPAIIIPPSPKMKIR